MSKLMFASSLDHLSGGDAWHCLLHLGSASPGHGDSLWRLEECSSKVLLITLLRIKSMGSPAFEQHLVNFSRLFNSVGTQTRAWSSPCFPPLNPFAFDLQEKLRSFRSSVFIFWFSIEFQSPGNIWRNRVIFEIMSIFSNFSPDLTRFNKRMETGVRKFFNILRIRCPWRNILSGFALGSWRLTEKSGILAQVS